MDKAPHHVSFSTDTKLLESQPGVGCKLKGFRGLELHSTKDSVGDWGKVKMPTCSPTGAVTLGYRTSAKVGSHSKTQCPRPQNSAMHELFPGLPGITPKKTTSKLPLKNSAQIKQNDCG